MVYSINKDEKCTKTYRLISFHCNCNVAISQELSNENGNKIIVMDGENPDWLDVFVNPTNFNCECEDRISITLKPTQVKNHYKTDDNIVTLEIKGNSYIFKTNKTDNCCFLKPGKYD
jgi:hypothetical protein